MLLDIFVNLCLISGILILAKIIWGIIVAPIKKHYAKQKMTSLLQNIGSLLEEAKKELADEIKKDENKEEEL
jgi:hypothetical protein